MLDEHLENPERLLPQFDPGAVLAQFTGSDIELEWPEAQKANIRTGWIGHKKTVREV